MARPTSTASATERGVDDLDRDGLGGALGVDEQLAGQVGADLGQALGELGQVGLDAGGAAGQQQHGVVGRHAAVGVEPVEGDLGGGAQRGVAAPRRSTSASVVSTDSMVARAGASMPAPLAMPPTM